MSVRRHLAPVVVPLLGVLTIAASYPENLQGDPPPGPVVAAADSLPEWERWADSVLGTLSLRAKAGQMLMRWIPGTFGGTATAEFTRAREWVTRDSLGGFIISIGAPEALARKTNALQALSRVPLLFAADLEFGPGQRLIPGGAAFPYPMGVAATGDTLTSCAHGRITARQARAVGIHWTFAPDVDLNTVPDNPIINVRAYGDTPAVVAPMAASFIRCAEAAGLFTTAKHFVGAGATRIDSHLALPVLPFDRARLDTMELVPFRAAQAAGVTAIMSGHVAFPRITGDSTPVSLDRRMLAGILRDEWGFDGLIVTDAIWMGGVTNRAGAGGERAAVQAIRAGNDLILDPRDPRATIDAIVAAVRTGELTEARIDSSVRRLLVLKARAGLASNRLVDVDAVPARMAMADADSVADRAARRSIVLARDAARLVPIDPAHTKRVLVVSYLDEGEEPAPGVRPSDAFVAELRELLGAIEVEHAATTRATTAQRYSALANRAGTADLVILAPYVRPVAERGSIGLPAAVERFYRRALARQPRTIIVSFGDPWLVRQLPDTGSVLLAWNPWSSPAERAAARALAGVAPITARLPVTLGPQFPRGGGVRMQAIHPLADPVHPDERTIATLRDTVQALLERAVQDSAFPGAVAAIGTADGILASVGVGTLDWTPSPTPGLGTLYDIASLTKVVGLTTAVMRLVEAGRLDLDAAVQRYLPEWTGPGKDRVTVRHLLTHTTGLPAFRRLFLESTNPDTVLRMVLETPLDTVPGARTVYSDFGLILAGKVVERITGEGLDRVLTREVFGPLGMTETTYRPPSELVARIAPTEWDPWRGQHVRGEVHDENTVALGGVSAHAGLFSTARDLARLARMYLNRGVLDGQRYLDPRTLALFTRVQDPALSHRALGWETPTGANSAGHRLSPASFGHTGFTGTSMWIDPENGVFVILLANRVNPSRENRRIFDVRVALADAVMDVLSPAGSPAPAPLASPSPSP